MYSVSIVMPIYNNEKTLRRAIDSILGQSLYALELILINNGSTDSSGAICEEYVKKEPLLVEVIHQERLGENYAKNIGLYHSNGSFIYFADPKTVYDKNFLYDNINLAVQKTADLVVFGFSSLTSDTEGEFEHHLPRMPFLESTVQFRDHFRNFYHFYPYNTFNKIYRRDYIVKNRVKFASATEFSDAFFNLDIYRELGRVAFNRKTYFHKESLDVYRSTTYDEKQFGQSIELANRLEETITYWNYTDEFSDIIAEEYYRAYYSEFANICRENSPYSQTEKEEKILSMIQERNFQQTFAQVKNQVVDLPFHKELIPLIQKRNSKGITELFFRNPNRSGKTNLKNLLWNTFGLGKKKLFN